MSEIKGYNPIEENKSIEDTIKSEPIRSDEVKTDNSASINFAESRFDQIEKELPKIEYTITKLRKGDPIRAELEKTRRILVNEYNWLMKFRNAVDNRHQPVAA